MQVSTENLLKKKANKGKAYARVRPYTLCINSSGE